MRRPRVAAGAKPIQTMLQLSDIFGQDEAIEWIKRAPFDGGAEIELRPVFEADDFGDALTPELREQEARLAADLHARNPQ